MAAQKSETRAKRLDEWRVYAGVLAAYETTESKELMNALMNLGKQTDWKPGYFVQ